MGATMLLYDTDMYAHRYMYVINVCVQCYICGRTICMHVTHISYVMLQM